MMTTDDSHAMALPSDRPLHAVLCLLLLAGFAEVYWATARYGPGLSGDSFSYMTAAESLVDSGVLMHAYDGIYKRWPPLFPATLAAWIVLFGDVLRGARWINALAFGATASLVAWSLHRATRSIVLGLAGGVLVLCSWPLLTVAAHVWSEPLFILLALGTVVMLGEHVFGGHPSALGWAIALAALACLQRYVGISVVATGVLGLLLFDHAPRLAARLRKAVLFGSLSVTPVLLWMARNYALTETPMGGWTAPHTTVWASITRLCSELVRALLPHRAGTLSSAWVLVCLAGVSLVILWSFFGRSGRSGPWSEQGSRGRILLVGLLGATYALVLVAAANIARFDRLNHRLVAPMLPSLFIVVCFSLHAGLKAALRDWARWGTRIAIAAATGLCLANGVALMGMGLGWRESGVGGANTSKWRESPTIQWLVANDPGRPIVSSEAMIVAFMSGKDAVIPPRKGASGGLGWWEEHSDALWAWFPKGNHANWYVTPDEAIELGVQLVRIAELNDADVYRIEGRPVEGRAP